MSNKGQVILFKNAEMRQILSLEEKLVIPNQDLMCIFFFACDITNLENIAWVVNIKGKNG